MCLMSIIIPCYNEFDCIDILYNKSLFITNNYDIEIIFVDNGSNDGSIKKFRDLKKSKKIKFNRIPINKGYGYGIKNSIYLCSGEYIGWTHADLQTDLFDVIKAYEIISKLNSNIINKKLILKGVRYGRSYAEIFFSNSMSFISYILFFPLKTYEICAQPSIFHNSIRNIIDNAPNGYEFDVHVFLVALIRNFIPYRFPVLFPERQYGKSHWNINIISKINFIRIMFFYLIKIFIYERLLPLLKIIKK